MPYTPSSIASQYNNNANLQYHDLENVRQIPAAGLIVARNSFTEEISSTQAVGVIGWSFRQNGLNYGCRIRDDDNKDVFEFGLEIPQGREYLHRSSDLSLAEKVHILTTVEQCLSPGKRQQHLRDLFELEKACFKPSAGIIGIGPKEHRRHVVPQGHITGHCGFSFANDEMSLELLKTEKKLKPAEPVLLLLEWEQGDKIYSIDCSKITPHFQIGYVANPNLPKLNMTRAEAKDAVDYARTKIKVLQPELNQLCAITGVWPRLAMTAEWLSMFRQPS